MFLEGLVSLIFLHYLICNKDVSSLGRVYLCRSNLLFKDVDTDSDVSDEDEQQQNNPQSNAYIPQRDPAEAMLEGGIQNVNSFLKRIKEFENITNEQLKDLWRIRDLAFAPLEVKVDVQEYIPGLFDILKPNEAVPLTKVLSVFCFLQIESINLKSEIEQKYFDPLIYFGESGALYEEERPFEETAGDMEMELARCLPVFNDFLQTLRKLIAITKNICL